MHDAVGVGVNKLSQAIRCVVGTHEAAFNPGSRPLRVQGLGIGYPEVKNTARLIGFARLEVYLHGASFGEAVIGGFVVLGVKAQLLIAAQRNADVVHGDNGIDAFEIDGRHSR